MIPQELDLVPGLDIASNLFLGHERLTTRRTLDGPRMMRGARPALQGPACRSILPTRCRRCAWGERAAGGDRQGAAADARILILDEPTAALSATEAEHLFMVVLELRARGVGIVYISHRLEEVARIADRVTVMRDGAVAGHAAPDAPQAELVRLLVGRDFSELFPAGTSGAGTELLSLSHARFLPAVPRAGWQAPVDVSLTVHAGEIVGLSRTDGRRTHRAAVRAVRIRGTRTLGRGHPYRRQTGPPR